MLPSETESVVRPVIGAENVGEEMVTPERLFILPVSAICRWSASSCSWMADDIGAGSLSTAVGICARSRVSSARSRAVRVGSSMKTVCCVTGVTVALTGAGGFGACAIVGDAAAAACAMTDGTGAGGALRMIRGLAEPG